MEDKGMISVEFNGDSGDSGDEYKGSVSSNTSNCSDKDQPGPTQTTLNIDDFKLFCHLKSPFPERETVIQQEEEDYAKEGSRTQQQEMMTEPLLDTASDCGSELPSFEGRSPSSFDQITSTSGGTNYVLNGAISPDSSKKLVASVLKQHQESEKKNNSTLLSPKKEPSMQSEINLLKQNQILAKQCKDLKKKIKSLSDSAFLTQEELEQKIKNYETEIKRLTKQHENRLEELERAHREEVENRDHKINELTEQLEENKRAHIKREEGHQIRFDDLREKHTTKLEDVTQDHKKKIEELVQHHQHEIFKLKQQCIKQKEDTLKQVSKIKQEHENEVRGLSKLRENLTRENTELKNKLHEPPELSSEASSSAITALNSSTASSLSTSFMSDDSDEQNASKPYDKPTYFHRSDSKLATIDVRFEEGMVKFIECKSPSTDIYNCYSNWYMDIVKKTEPEIIYQTKRHIFLRRSYNEVLTVDKRRFSFSSIEPGKISFNKMKCVAHEYSDEGWPKEIDHVLALHPLKATFKEFLRFTKKNDQGEEYCEWSATKIRDEFYHQMEDQFGNKCFTILLCAYVKEEEK